MTSVEWLEKQLLSHTKIENSKYIQQKIVDIAVWQLDKYLEQAKQMEKEQISEAHRNGAAKITLKEYKSGEQYYKETYGQE